MNIFTWAEKRTQQLKWYHYGSLKMGVACAVLLLAKLFPVVLSLSWYWYLGAFVLFYAILLMGFFKTKA